MPVLRLPLSTTTANKRLMRFMLTNRPASVTGACLFSGRSTSTFLGSIHWQCTCMSHTCARGRRSRPSRRVPRAELVQVTCKGDNVTMTVWWLCVKSIKPSIPSSSSSTTTIIYLIHNCIILYTAKIKLFQLFFYSFLMCRYAAVFHRQLRREHASSWSATDRRTHRTYIKLECKM